MRVLMVDAGLAFDGLTPRERALGGAESAFVAMAEALAAEGALVEARAREARRMLLAGVQWRPLDDPWPVDADLYLVNRDPSLLWRRIKARRTAFWLHNPAQFLRKPRYLAPLLVKRPTLVFAGASHAATAPDWTPCGGRAAIPLGVEQVFLETQRAPGPPPPRAVFTSNPLRGLDPLLDLWTRHIHPRVRGAELHVFSGPQTYAAAGPRADAMRRVVERAQRLNGAGVVVREPAAKAGLARELAQARVMLYLGDPGETFCLAVAEAQGMGVPCVVAPVGATGERVEPGVTGYVEADPARFCDRALDILTQDTTWTRLSQAALARRPQMSWAVAARRALSLLA